MARAPTTDDLKVIAVGLGAVALAYIVYQVIKGGQTVGQAVSNTVSAAANIITAPGQALGGAIYDATHNAQSSTTFDSNQVIAWKKAMVSWLMSQGATNWEALTVVGAWQQGFPAPTMQNVQNYRNGQSIY